MKKQNKVTAPVTVPVPSPASQPTRETDEQKQARVQAASKELQALCTKYNVAFHVPTLDISSGKIWPVINLLALDIPAS